MRIHSGNENCLEVRKNFSLTEVFRARCIENNAKEQVYCFSFTIGDN